MSAQFSSEFFAGNRARLKQLFAGTAPIVLAANGLLQRGGDSTYAFAQDASFWYLTGCEEPDVVLVMDKTKEYLIVPARDASRVAFDGAVDDDELRRVSGIAQIYESEEGWRQLTARLKRVKHVATLAAAPPYIGQYGMYVNPARAQLIDRLKDANGELELLDIGGQLVRLRVTKQPAELAAIRQAIAVTNRTLKHVLAPGQLTKYKHEYEIEADISRGFRRLGASGHGFAPIVASGGRACTLHNVHNNGPLKATDLLTVDVGAEYNHYSADITRTVSLGGKSSKRQRAVYDAVLAAHAFALALVKPGALIHDNERRVEHFLGEKLRELGLIKTINKSSVRQFYPHATSHFLGLNVHDVGDYDQPLGVGMVLTVEPGIYIKDEGIGVRIEDDVLVTKNGCEILSDALPRQLTLA